MTRHVADKNKLRNDDGRLAQYTRIEREAKPNPKAQALQRQRKSSDGKAVMREFARIDRSAE